MTGDAAAFAWLPDELPPGRLVVPDPDYADGDPVTDPVLWVSDLPVPDAGPLWASLLGQHARSGLWPLLLTGPQDLSGVVRLACRGHPRQRPAQYPPTDRCYEVLGQAPVCHAQVGRFQDVVRTSDRTPVSWSNPALASVVSRMRFVAAAVAAIIMS